MSSILPFVVVALITVVVASMTLRSAAQPATESNRVARGPWTWLLAALSAIRRWRRGRRGSANADRPAQQTTDQLRPTPQPTAPGRTELAPATNERVSPRVKVEAPAPPGVLTALRLEPDITVADTIGDELARKGPGFLIRVRSALGLILLIAVLGLGLAAGLGAAAAALSAVMDSFVN